MRFLLALAAAALMLTGCGHAPATTTTATPSASSPTPDPAALAIQRCRTEVLKWLKAPATARWSGEHTTPDGDGFEVTGSVDSQNSFGALLRSTYLCHTSPSKGTHAFVS